MGNRDRSARFGRCAAMFFAQSFFAGGAARGRIAIRCAFASNTSVRSRCNYTLRSFVIFADRHCHSIFTYALFIV